MKPFRLDLTLTCLEDLHIGSGLAELGAHDAGCAVDRHGNPWVPRTTLMGLMREGCRKVIEDRRAFGMDITENKAAFQRLFNYAAGDSLLVAPLRWQSGPSDPWITHSFTAVDFDGRVLDHTLRTWQCVRRGTVFHGQIHGTAAEESDLDLLINGLKRIRRWGGGRNRGLGLAALNIDKKFLDIVREKASHPLSKHIQGSGFLLWKIRLEDLTSIAKGATAGNILFGRDYLRGENVLGAWRHFLRTRIQEKIALLDDPVGKPKVRFSNLLPLPADTQLANLNPHAVIPVPFTLRQPKPTELRARAHPDVMLQLPPWAPLWPKPSDITEAGAEDTFTAQGEDPAKETTTGKVKRKKMQGYLLCQDGKFQQVNSPLARNLRNAVDEESGTVRENQLFTEDSLPEDSTFFGWAQFEDKETAQAFLDGFAPWLPEGAQEGEPLGLGKGRKCARITDLHWWAIPEIKENGAGETGSFQLTLVSDTIAVDPATGESLHQLNPEQLSLLWPALADKAAWVRAEQRSQPRHRMHGSGGFFTPPQHVLLAGSVYLCRFHDSISTEEKSATWTQLHQQAQNYQPVGEATHMGYGQWALDLAVPQPAKQTTSEENKDPDWLKPQFTGLPTNHDGVRERLLRKAKNDFDELYKVFALARATRTKLTSLLAAAEFATSEADWTALWDSLIHHAGKAMETLWNLRPKRGREPETHLSQALKDLYGDWTQRDRFILFLRHWIQEKGGS